MIWILKLMILVGCIELWYWGGQPNRRWCRDMVIPFLLGIYLGFHSTWWIGFLSIGAFQIVRIGYGISSKLDGDPGSWLGQTFKTPWLVRGIAGGLYGLSGLSVYVAFKQQFVVYIVYVFLNGIVNACVERFGLRVNLCDRFRGLAIGSLVLLI